jgi:hypothetical protein
VKQKTARERHNITKVREKKCDNGAGVSVTMRINKRRWRKGMLILWSVRDTASVCAIMHPRPKHKGFGGHERYHRRE